MKKLSGYDVVSILVDVETNAEKFYHELKHHAQNLEIRKIFTKIASEEAQHKDALKNLLASLENNKEEAYPGEYSLYLNSLTDDLIFKKSDNVVKLVQDIQTEEGAINLAIRCEKDVLLFLRELAEFINVADRKVLSALIQEERKHLKDLYTLFSSL